MANDGFNKATVSFAGITCTTKLRRIDNPQTAAKVNVTAANDSTQTKEVGIPEVPVTIECVGRIAGIFVGQKGPLAITWPDGSTDGAITNAACFGIHASGSMNGEKTTVYEFDASTASGT